MENEAFALKEEMLNFPQYRSVPILRADWGPLISFAVYAGRALTSSENLLFFKFWEPRRKQACLAQKTCTL